MTTTTAPPTASPSTAPPTAPEPASTEDGSLVSEYGLVAVLGATIAGVAISWAKGGAIATLLGTVLEQVRAVAGA